MHHNYNDMFVATDTFSSNFKGLSEHGIGYITRMMSLGFFRNG